MFKKAFLIILAIGFIISGTCFAHTPLCSCYDNGDGTVSCEGGFSDGSSAAGVEIRVEDEKGQALIQGEMNEDSEYTFDKPSSDYTVVFDAGEGHEIKVDSKEIIE